MLNNSSSDRQKAEDSDYLMELICHDLLIGEVTLWVDFFQQALRSWNRQLCRRLIRIGKRTSEASLTTRWIVRRWEGKYWLQFGEWGNAVGAFQKALKDLPANRDRDLLNLLSELGQAHRWLGNYEQAKRLYERSLAISIDLGDRKATARMQSNLGVVARLQGRINEAVQYLKRSLQYYEEIGSIEKQVKVLNNLGVIYKNLSDWEEATNCYEQAKLLIEPSHDKRTLGIILVNLGNCLYPQGNWDDAYTAYEDALRIFVELEDPIGSIRALTGLGIVSGYKGQWSQAEGFYRQSVQHANEFGDPLGQADALHNLGIALARQGHSEKAESCYRQSLEIYDSMEHIAGREHVLNSWGRLLEEREEYEGAIEYYRKCVQISQKLNAKWDEIDARINLARALRKKGAIYEAQAKLKNVISESQDNEFSDMQAWALKEWGDTSLLTGAFDESLEVYECALSVASTVNPHIPQQMLSSIKKTIESMKNPPQEMEDWLHQVGIEGEKE